MGSVRAVVGPVLVEAGAAGLAVEDLRFLVAAYRLGAVEQVCFLADVAGKGSWSGAGGRFVVAAQVGDCRVDSYDRDVAAASGVVR